jgi:soluble lytic murein transglycosylase
MVKPRKQPAWTSISAVVAGVIGILAIIAIALGFYSGGFKSGGSDPFPGDRVLSQAARSLASAERRIRQNANDESAHLERARSWLTLGHLEGARIELEQWLENGGPEWGDLARSLDELKLKTDEIRALLHEAETSPHPSEKYPPIYALLDDIASRYEGIPKYRALFLKGYLLLRESRKGEAEPIFGEELTTYYPLEAYVKYNYARSVSVTGNEEAALALFDEFIREFASNRLAPLAHLERVNILREAGRDDEAIEECRRMLDRYPTSSFAPKALRKWAEIYEDRMDFENGADIRVRIVRDYPDSEEASDTLEMFFGGLYSLQLLDEGDRLVLTYEALWNHPNDALAVLTQLADSQNLTAEERAKACHGASRCEFALGHYYDSIEWGNRARDLAPQSESGDRAGIRNGWSYSRLNKNDLALEEFRKVAEGHGPLAPIGAQSLCEQAYSMRDLATVKDACTLIIEEYPDSDQTPAALTMLAYLGCRDGLYQSARGYASRCVDNFPDSPESAEAGFWLARAMQGLGRSQEAERAFEGLAKRVPWDFWGIRAAETTRLNDLQYDLLDPMAFNIQRLSCFDSGIAVAWELYDAGTLELAESEFDLALDNGIKGAACGLALVYAEQGRIREGIVELRDAAAVGDQAYLTPEKQNRVLNYLYPRPFESEVRNAALAHDVPPSWLWGAMRQESSFNPDARSGSDARGLIQIMPQTGRFIADQRGAATFDPETLWDPEVNLDYAAWYFAYLRGEVGGDRLLDVLAAYNGGPGAWRSYRQLLPTRDDDIFISAIPSAETSNFAHWVYANVMMYEYILDKEGYQVVPF